MQWCDFTEKLKMAKNNNVNSNRLLPVLISFMALLLCSQLLLPVMTASAAAAALVVSPVLGNQLGTATPPQHETATLQPAEEITTIKFTTTTTNSSSREVSGASRKLGVANLEKKMNGDGEGVAFDQKLEVQMKKKMWRRRPPTHKGSAHRMMPMSASIPALLILGSLIVLSSF